MHKKEIPPARSGHAGLLNLNIDNVYDPFSASGLSLRVSGRKTYGHPPLREHTQQINFDTMFFHDAFPEREAMWET